jgi:ribosomal protein S27E
MPIDTRDWFRTEHPPACTCTWCIDLKSRGIKIESLWQSEIYWISAKCPFCETETLYYDKMFDRVHCFRCKASGYTPNEIHKKIRPGMRPDFTKEASK